MKVRMVQNERRVVSVRMEHVVGLSPALERCRKLELGEPISPWLVKVKERLKMGWVTM